MTIWMKSGVAACVLALSAIGATAQESSNRVAAKTDWSVFVDDNPTECWAVSSPKETVNTDESGRIKAVSRGRIYMLVFHRPSDGINGQIQFAGGYPFADGSTVSLKVGDSEFELFTDGESAWPATASDDAKIITSMKRGANAIATGRSSRGTITKDTFSLFGFTAAMEEVEKRCGG